MAKNKWKSSKQTLRVDLNFFGKEEVSELFDLLKGIDQDKVEYFTDFYFRKLALLRSSHQHFEENYLKSSDRRNNLYTLIEECESLLPKTSDLYLGGLWSELQAFLMLNGIEDLCETRENLNNSLRRFLHLLYLAERNKVFDRTIKKSNIENNQFAINISSGMTEILHVKPTAYYSSDYNSGGLYAKLLQFGFKIVGLQPNVERLVKKYAKLS